MVRKGIGEVMGGKVLELETERLRAEGYNVFILQYRVAAGKTTTNELIKSQEVIANSAGGRLSQLWGLDNEYFAGCYGTQPPTFFAYVKEDKVIGEQNVKDIEKTIDIMKNLDKDIEVRAYDHAYHGFGTGAGTDADGWMDEAISFSQNEM